MKSSDTIGHSPVLCWYRGKTAGAREQNPRNIERGRQGVKNLAASVFFTPWAGEQNRRGFSPFTLSCRIVPERGGPARSGWCPGPPMPMGWPWAHRKITPPSPRLGPFWKINLCGASEARLFSAKNPKFSGVFRYAFTKSGESIPPFRGYGQEKER